MDNFNITKWNRNRYLSEGKIDEYGEYDSKAKDLTIDIKKILAKYSPYVSMGMYSGDRPDSDPLKDKGYGSISFRSYELPDDDWNKALKWVESNGFEVTSDSNYYEEDPGERYYYPKIKFEFDVADFPIKEGMSKAGIMKQIKDAEEILDSGEANGMPLDNETEMLVQNELKRLLSLYKSVNEMDINDPILVKMRAAKDRTERELSKSDFGKEYGDAVKVAYGNDKNAKKLAFLKKERAQLMRDMEQEAEPEGGPIADEYGNKLNSIDAAIAKLSGRKEMTYNQAIAEGMEASEFLATVNDEFDIETLELMKGAIDKRVLFLQKMMDVANPRPVVKGFMKESASKEEKRIAMRAIKSIAKYRGVSEDEAKRDLTRAIDELGSLKEAIKDIKETIELGKNLNEDLCAKGKAYRKKRMAAGEKSSAYLNGRAVKVCKGQMKG